MNGDQLCGSVEQPPNVCGDSQNPIWDSCCDVDGNCRRHSVPIHSTCTDSGSVLKLKIRFDNTGPDCCKTCSVYGDPELVSFNNKKDKLILCDARDESCRIKRSVCNELKDQNGNPCKWVSDRDDR